MEKFVIDAGVEMVNAGRKTFYPFDKMKVGDSFFAPQVEGRTKNRHQNVVSSSARYYAKLNDVAFKTRSAVETKIHSSGVDSNVPGVRVWRVK